MNDARASGSTRDYKMADLPPIAVRCAIARVLPSDLLDECLEEELSIFYEEHALKSSGEIALRRGYTDEPLLAEEAKKAVKELMDPQAENVVQGGDITGVSAFVNRGDILAILKEQAELARQGSYVSLYDLAESKGFTPNQPEHGEKEESYPHIDGYEFVDIIGRGGMGKVYKCHQLSMDRLVAIKILHPDRTKTPGFVQRFVKEARSVARLNHPNIISGIDCGQSGDNYFFVMEYFDGNAVSQLIRERGHIAEQDALMIALQVARALEAAREQGIIHRDIKPGNMLINEKGIVKLTDLGLVKFVGGKLRDEDTLTSAMTTVGTPQYLSPEQAKGLPVDTRSDIYSLGISLFTMLAGRFPFEGSPLEIIVKHITEPMPAVKDFVPGISEETCAMIEKMTAKHPEKRFQTPSEVEKRIVQVLQKLGGQLAESLRNDQMLDQIRKEHKYAATIDEGIESELAAEPLSAQDTPRVGRGSLDGDQEEVLFKDSASDLASAATGLPDGTEMTPTDNFDLREIDDLAPSPDSRIPTIEAVEEKADPAETAHDPMTGVDNAFSEVFDFDIQEEAETATTDASSPFAPPTGPLRQSVDEFEKPAEIESVYVLVAVDGPLIGQSFPLEEGKEITAGRDPDVCAIVLNDGSVSRHHCAISFDVGRLLVIDLGSHNGTYINGEKIQTDHLYPGDLLQIGKNRFRLAIQAKE